jgi:hypothetical protein
MDLEALTDEGLADLKRKVILEEEFRASKKRKKTWSEEFKSHPCVGVDYSDHKTWISENIKHCGAAILEQDILDHLDDEFANNFRAVANTYIKITFTALCIDGDIRDLNPSMDDYEKPDGSEKFGLLFPCIEDLKDLDNVTEDDLYFETSGPNEYLHADHKVWMAVVCPKLAKEDFEHETRVITVTRKKWYEDVITRVGEDQYQYGPKIMRFEELENQDFFVPKKK